jgi:hypothetical protein
VQVYVARLREALGDAHALETTPAGCRLRCVPTSLDAERFAPLSRTRAARSRPGMPSTPPPCCGRRLRYRGPPLIELEFEPFAHAEIGRPR